MANANVNKVTLSNGTTLIDLTADTVTSAAHIVSGYIGHLADGSTVTGTASGGATLEDEANTTGTTAVITGAEVSSYNALYPLTNTRTDGVLSNNVLIQEKNGHVKISFPTAISGSGLTINLTDAIASTNASISINNRQKWFDIPVGSVTHTVSNVLNTSNIRWNANCRNLSSSSLAFALGDETHTTGSTTTVDVTASQSAGCYFVYIDLSTVSLNAVLEFDVSFTVNGIRYF